MGKLIVWNLMTLDGYFEGRKPWDLDWHSTVWGEELEALSIEQLKSADALLFGRNTYLGMAAYWPTAPAAEGAVTDLMNGIPKIVFSRTLQKAAWNNTRIVGTEAATEVPGLKKKYQKDLFIFGSAALCQSLLAAGLIDEYRLGLVPVLLGGGTPLFKPGPDTRKFTLMDARPLKSGCVILRYKPAA